MTHHSSFTARPIIQWRSDPEMKTKLLLAVLLATSMITACSGVMDSAQPARQTYMLMPAPQSSGTPNDGQGPVLSVSLVAVPGLDTDHIQALDSDAQLKRYANARWPDHLPEVLGSVMQRSLATSGRFSTVEQSSRASGDGWLLQLEVQKFYGLQSTSGTTNSVVVEVSGSIECAGNKETFTLSDSQAVGEERLSTVVAAHQRGLNEVTRQILETINDWCS
jgi:ABC-type uncharacterized transport system auxiliary subunit